MLAKPSTQLTMRTHPSAGVFSLLKFALSHEEEEEEEDVILLTLYGVSL